MCLVEADLRRPAIANFFGLDGNIGLSDVLVSDVDLEDVLVRWENPNLTVLPAGSVPPDSTALLGSAAMADLVRTLGARYDVVIFDSPPALAASPAAELAKHCGQALVICRADRTGQSALEDALSLLSACPDIKLLLNSANFSPSGRRFGDYYGYGGASA